MFIHRPSLNCNGRYLVFDENTKSLFAIRTCMVSAYYHSFLAGMHFSYVADMKLCDAPLSSTAVVVVLWQCTGNSNSSEHAITLVVIFPNNHLFSTGVALGVALAVFCWGVQPHCSIFCCHWCGCVLGVVGVSVIHVNNFTLFNVFLNIMHSAMAVEWCLTVTNATTLESTTSLHAAPMGSVGISRIVPTVLCVMTSLTADKASGPLSDLMSVLLCMMVLLHGIKFHRYNIT